MTSPVRVVDRADDSPHPPIRVLHQVLPALSSIRCVEPSLAESKGREAGTLVAGAVFQSTQNNWMDRPARGGPCRGGEGRAPQSRWRANLALPVGENVERS